MRKLLRGVFSSAAVALVSLALATAPTEAAGCRPAYFVALDEYHCADYCHGQRCNYYYDEPFCVCDFP